MEVVHVFHSPLESLKIYAAPESTAPFPILADPERKVYNLFGLEKSWWTLMHPRSLGRLMGAASRGMRPRVTDMAKDGITSKPADFLIGVDGKVERFHLGRGFADSLQPAELLDWLQELS